jgi:hypothetical protein
MYNNSRFFFEREAIIQKIEEIKANEKKALSF